MLKGEKVVLREKRLEDAANDYAWRSDEELARLDAAPTLSAPFVEFLASYADELRYPSPYRHRFAIETLGGKHIGNCMYYDIDAARGEAELGIMIGDRDYWGQGYGTDAVTTLLDHVFSTTRLNRIYLNTLDWNIRAQRCFGKCGFVPVDQAKRRNRHFVLMEIYRNSWEKHTSRGGGRSPKQKQEG